jgi:hypothetical protein
MLDEQGFFPTDQRNIGEPFQAEPGKNALGMTVTKRAKTGSTLQAEDSPPPGVATQVSMTKLNPLLLSGAFLSSIAVSC